ncbi:MAG: Ldh family oxidoreductase [Ferruginibacter sp.]|nr:Ldh family oxidoreductase [Ferruginibacter sp.]
MIQYFSHVDLHSFCVSIFKKIGYDSELAKQASDVLLSADLRGVDSHGVARLSGYVRLWEVKRILVDVRPSIIHETPSTAVVDGGSGLGLVVAPYSMNLAIEKALSVGSGWVSVQNSSHFGIAGIHAMMALPYNMIGIAMTNASPIVAPTFSSSRMLGTNPIAVAVPAGEEPAFIADFATTTVANGKLEIMQRLGQSIPTGWVQTKEGESSTDPNELKNGGALLPLGGDREHSGHKGYMLGSVVDILSAVLSGANFGPFVPPFPAYIPMPTFMPGKGIGHFFGALRIDAFRLAADFKKDMDLWIRSFRKANPKNINQSVLIPGDLERKMEIERKASGIPLLESVIKDLQLLGNKLGVEFPHALTIE